jgi:hypothetical protein
MIAGVAQCCSVLESVLGSRRIRGARRASQLVVIAATLLGCSDTPTESGRQILGSANLTIETSDGTRTAAGVEAGFHVYSPGPTSSTRAMYVVLGTREAKPGAVSGVANSSVHESSPSRFA